MHYGKMLMDAFNAKANDFRDRNEYEQAFVMDSMENAVNNVMHGRTEDEIRAHALRHIGLVLADERMALSDTERATYEVARSVVRSVG